MTTAKPHSVHPSSSRLHPFGLPGRSGVVAVADDAVGDDHDAEEVVKVAAERGGVAEQGATTARQRPRKFVEDAAAQNAGGVAGQRAVHECHAALVQHAAAKGGGVAGQGAVADSYGYRAAAEEEAGAKDAAAIGGG